MYPLYPLPEDALSADPLIALGRLQQNWLDNGLGVLGYWQAWLQDAQTLQGALWREYLLWCERFNATMPPTPALLGVPSGNPTVVPEPAAAPLDESDELTRIQGIGKVLQERLHAAGVRTFGQIAAWDASEIARVEEEVLGSRFSGRVARDRWQEQARALQRG